METLPYGDHPEQTGDLYLPDGEPVGAVVLWHGGGFARDYTRAMLDPLARELAARGLAAYNATYRRLDCGGGAEETFGDALAAVDALVDRLGLRAPPAGIGLSAGALLALHAAASGRLARVVDIAGIAALADATRSRGPDSNLWRLMGAGPDDAPDRYAALDPAARLPLPVRSLILHGDADDVVPLAHSQTFAAAAGPTCELVVVPGAGHFDLYGLRTPAPAALFAFLLSDSHPAGTATER